jgi:2-dehydropantoate 2-reductase
MHYLIYGTGAVGGLIGGQLALSGQRVTFLARPRVTEALRTNGLMIQSQGKNRRLEQPDVVTDLQAAFTNHIPDLIVLTVKAYDCQSAAQDIQNTLGAQIPVLSMLNGIGSEEMLAAVLGEPLVLSGTLTTAVQHLKPGFIRIERERGVGLAQDHPIVSAVEVEMQQAGFEVRRFQDRRRMKWSKLMTNIVANATSAILGWSPDQIFAHAGLARLEIEALRETIRVMRGMGIQPQNLPGVPVALLGRAIFLPAKVTRPILRQVVAKGRGDKLPSFHYDIGRGRSEVEWLNGAVVHAGSQINIATPANHVLTQTLRKLVRDQAASSAYHDRPEELLNLAKAVGVPGITATK